jgi:hypothetical protein
MISINKPSFRRRLATLRYASHLVKELLKTVEGSCQETADGVSLIVSFKFVVCVFVCVCVCVCVCMYVCMYVCMCE